MDSFKYLFKGSSKLWILFFFMSFIAINCQNGCGGCNGCTTSVVVDQESRKQTVDGVRIKVTANKNRVTNRKLRINQEIRIDKTVWYSVDYYLSVEKRPEIKNICELEVPENVDLEKSLAEFNIKFSPDTQHFAVGLNDKVYDFFHLLKAGVPFSSGCFYLNDSNYVFLNTANLDFNKINWSKFPSTEILFDKIIIPNNYAVWTLACNQDNVLELLNEMPPGNSHEMVLMENWFCEMADLHFNEQRVQEIIKVSPPWKRLAEKQLIYAVDNSVSENNQELKESLDMVLWINDSKTLNIADSIVFDDYFAAGYVGDYMVERFKNKNSPVNNKIHASILSKAKKIGINFQQNNDEMNEITAINILLICKENQILKDFIDKNIRKDVLINDFNDICSSTIRIFDAYPKELQSLIVKRYLEVAQQPEPGLFALDISEVVEFLKDKISCEELKKIVELHKSNLYTFRMPDGC